MTLDEVEYWLEKQVPIFCASKKFEKRFSNKDKIYEVWTTGSYDDDALEYLEKRKAEIKKYNINWRDGNYILSLSKKLETKTIYKTLKKYYFDHSVDKKLGLESTIS